MSSLKHLVRIPTVTEETTAEGSCLMVCPCRHKYSVGEARLSIRLQKKVMTGQRTNCTRWSSLTQGGLYRSAQQLLRDTMQRWTQLLLAAFKKKKEKKKANILQECVKCAAWEEKFDICGCLLDIKSWQGFQGAAFLSPHCADVQYTSIRLKVLTCEKGGGYIRVWCRCLKMMQIRWCQNTAAQLKTHPFINRHALIGKEWRAAFVNNNRNNNDIRSKALKKRTPDAS